MGVLDGVRDCHANIGSFYLRQKIYDSALYYLDAALADMDLRNFREGSESTTADILLNKIRVYLPLERVDEAAGMLLQLEPLILKIKQPDYEMDYYRQSGNIYSRQSQFAKAERQFDKALKLLSENESVKRQMDLYRDMSRHYVRTGDFKTALAYTTQFEALEDSIFDREKSERIATLQTQFQVQEKELTISRLEQENLQTQVEAQASKRQRDLYLFVGVLLLFISSALFYSYRLKSKANKKLVKSDIEKETLLQEIHHRVKNNLQVISSLLAVQAKEYDHPAIAEFVSNGRSRVQAMALVHQFLYQDRDSSVISYGDYLKELTKNIFDFNNTTDQIKYQIDSDTIYLDIDTAIPLGLITSEIITNALKYAFPTGEGNVKIVLRRDGDQFELQVADSGKGISEKDLEKANSFGLSLIRNLTKRIKGELHIENNQGTIFNISFHHPMATIS